MTLDEFLNSNLLPRTEKVPDVWSREPYWALPDVLSVYTYGFNNADYEHQSHPLVQNIQDLDGDKYKELFKYKDCEVKRVNTFIAEGKIIVHIQIIVEEEK